MKRNVFAAVLTAVALFGVAAPASAAKSMVIPIACSDGECFGPGIGQDGMPHMRWVGTSTCESGGGEVVDGMCSGGRHDGAAILD